LYPLTGVHSLPLDTSVSEGVAILNSSIDTNIAAGDSSTVFGYSQSGIIASLESEQLDPLGTPSTDPVDFVLIGDPMNPDGGFWERFAGLDIASIGATLYGATPADDFSTVIYTAEYDGVADFPQYPLNLLSDLNAELGFLYVHGTYPDLTPTQVTPVADGGDAIALMTSGPTETTYYMIPTTDLPLLDPVRDIPGIGNPLADLLQPDLTYLVNLGYGDPLQGWSTGPANVATGFGLFPPLSDIEKLPGLLLSGTEQGIQNFIGDFTGTGPDPVTLSIGSLLDPSSAALPSDPATSITDIANALSSAASALYSALLPTADLINSLVTTIPAYDASIFTGNLEAGNVLDALGLPIAADTGLVSMGALLEISVVADAASAALSDLTSLIS
jgi:PE-PPE domain